MSELLPTLQAEDIRKGLLDYLTTTFALADPETKQSLSRFLEDPEMGIFRGPYVRLRLPFEPAAAGWEHSLQWQPPRRPYGHQAAAYERLSSLPRPGHTEPQPTLVTTGTGSGKTEAFLHPIVDHVLRAKRDGVQGVKALILYPMNALANDQARRIAELITGDPALGGIRAALYTGQDGPTQRTVTADNLITERDEIRALAPDILLTNYKMLDQLLLRPGDRALWDQSALSLRYLVLDEFHTYDGAQGTDVAMLLRRLGLALKSRWPSDADVPDVARDRPLGLLTPVATSATLGDGGDPAAMVDFANTVFGGGFDADSVVTETRQTLDDWVDQSEELLADIDLVAAEVTDLRVHGLLELIDADAMTGPRDADLLTERVVDWLYATQDEQDAEDDGQRARERLHLALDSAPNRADRFALLLHLLQAHPFVQELVRRAATSVPLSTLSAQVFPNELAASQTATDRDSDRSRALIAVFGALSHVRKEAGRDAVSVDLHLWIRALSRVDRFAQASPAFAWTDDGDVPSVEQLDAAQAPDAHAFPAVFCRHCGRSGWGVELGPIGFSLSTDDDSIRGNHAARSKKSRFRALIHAPREGEVALEGTDESAEQLRWLHVENRELRIDLPSAAEREANTILPVLTLIDTDADEESGRDTCPNCGKREGIRFLGSAIATQLSVVVTTLFGDRDLDQGEKKALVFTDSVQDAAHRAGFIQSRAHVFNLRNAVRSVVNGPMSLDDVADAMIQAATTPAERYRLLPPDLVDRAGFGAFWDPDKKPSPAVKNRVKERVRFDVALEFGLQSRVGRTLEETGSLVASVDAGTASRLEAIGRAAIDGIETAGRLDDDSDGTITSDALVRWVRGTLERLRERGAIEHTWLRRYIEENGERWWVWGGRPARRQGMPAFPNGREAPAFARFGPKAQGGRESNLDQASSPQSWYARWTRKNLDVSAAVSANLVRRLFERLDHEEIVVSWPIKGSEARAYGLRPSSVIVAPADDAALTSGDLIMVCDTCETTTPVAAAVASQLVGGPCTADRCRGHLLRSEGDADNYYRRQYDTGTMRRVVAREHTGLLDDKTRLEYENAFKSSDTRPDAPNVLVATPTLEMGIDIGDLSTVFLAGLPRSVSSYLQRVGRAGRLTGNALITAFVLGRGAQLPKIGDPLSVINGSVRPPATYLNAVEIIRRQYTAFVVDQLAAADDLGMVKDAMSVLRKTEGTSFIAKVTSTAESRSEEFLDAFLGSMDGVSDGSKAALRTWAVMVDDVAGSSGLAQTMVRASTDWNHDAETLRLRRKQIEESLPQLEQQAEASKEDSAITALRSARASLRLVRKQLQELRGEFWIAALERFGVLPNYTLLDDRVQLNVGLSWVDPESGEFETDDRTYERGRSIAISELAPGSRFYAQGLEIDIDAVDLGQDGERIHTTVFCPACGFAADIDGEHPAPSVCPRCGTTAIADTNQRYSTVEMEQVSAEVRRDESTINDADDDRTRTRFTLQLAADIDPASILEPWFVDEVGLGVKYSRSMTIRWLNLGKASSGGNRVIAGSEHAAPLFRLCRACGKLDRDAGKNTANEHRAWCPHRKSADEHTESIVLTRTLRTQAILLRVPTSMTIGDSLSLPSLSAAIQLGLREVIGGDPDHLHIATCVEPLLGHEVNNEALLIHDTVPGGTGYLADLAEPARIREVLERARTVLQACRCATDDRRSACDQCLLPYAPGGNADAVSRASALRNLEKLLQVRDGEQRDWVVDSVDNPVEDPESHLEQWFRKVFKERVITLGASIKETDTEWGSKVQVTLPNQHRTWTLRPQPQIGGTQPDFVLEATGAPLPPIAIYTDGYAYHASPAHNRLADDAAKRRGLRELGYNVLAITWQDMQRAVDGGDGQLPAWYDASRTVGVEAKYLLAPAALEMLRRDPMRLLMGWIADPETTHGHWQRVARAIPMLSYAASAPEHLEATPFAPVASEFADLAERDGGRSWTFARPGLALLSRSSPGDTPPVPAWAAAMIDDSTERVAQHDFAAMWAEWLHLGNLLGVGDVRTPLIGTTSELEDLNIVQAPTAASQDPSRESVPLQWREVLELAETGEQELLLRLALEAEIDRIPEVGVEVEDGIPLSIGWSSMKLAVDSALTGVDRNDLEAAGWNVVPADYDDIVEAFTARAAETDGTDA
ncbi:DEAD/DEAH box helicase [Curtobacterium sp. Leaf261]|uniref:DEAD/DEAH box helicase n=1 Tax=Curtobacterium sp. Leaf261 TaxID=1736311 RepID=UPI0006F90860|nr:DEAD/DEAH box helicase [Curtobacterium sp. Leaf261]KQO65174.1 hypothetical protein ASF23_03420 [Curtobacterium sp. Leaf261]